MKPKTEKTELEALASLFERHTAGLKSVARKRLFGCDGFFKGQDIFGLIWKTGRIGVKLPRPELHDALMAHPGSAPWKAGERTMAHWVLVPPSFHQNEASLKEWIAKAHSLAGSAKPKVKARPKTGQKATKKKSAKSTTRPRTKR